MRCSPYLLDEINKITGYYTIRVFFLLDTQFKKVYNSCAPEIQMFSNFSFLNFVLKLWVVTLYHTDILLRTACAYFFCPNECVAPVCILWNTPLQSRLVENRPPISLIFKFVNHRPPIFYIFYIVHPTQFP